MAEHDDGQLLAELTVRACEYCGGSIPKRRKDARFCSTSHRVMAHRKAKREREIHDSLVTRGLTDQSLAELHERARPGLVQGDEDFVVPARSADEFGMTDGLLDDEPNAAWSMRLKLEAETDRDPCEVRGGDPALAVRLPPQSRAGPEAHRDHQEDAAPRSARSSGGITSRRRASWQPPTMRPAGHKLALRNVTRNS